LPGHEILTVAEAQAADRAAVAAGVESFTLMHNAGAAIADAISLRWTARPTLVLCGPGNNGGDGYVTAALLKAKGYPVRVSALAEPTAADARRARALWQEPLVPFGPEAVGGAELIVVALFGAGLSRPLEGPAVDVLRAAEATNVPIVAVDLPSGLQGDTGKPLGYAPRALLTVTFHRKKPAHLLEPGRSLCGDVVVANIGIPDAATPSLALWENHPDLWLPHVPWPGPETHKHARGRLGVVSGPMTSTGAARMAARAGLRCGAGLVKVFCPPDAAAVVASHLEAIMLQPFESDTELEHEAAAMDAMVIGPAAGLNERTKANLAALVRTGAALVIDADALTLFRDDPSALFALLDRDDVLTPHAGEFERIFPGLLSEAPERVSAVRRAAAKAGAVVLLKGFDTVVAAPDGRAVINGCGSAWLATAGSGDVLSGLIGGFLAQKMDSFRAASAAVYVHARAAEAFGPGLIAEDLPGLVPGVLAELYEIARNAR
jgi:hydroxyethylthiazole kinase-like uncharacterized protein yjeF